MIERRENMKPEEKKPTGSLNAVIMCILFLACDVIYYLQAKGSQVNESITFSDQAFRRLEIVNGAGSAMVLSGAGLLISRLKEKKAVRAAAVGLIAVGLTLVGWFFLNAM